jgi:hypothetical protein
LLTLLRYMSDFAVDEWEVAEIAIVIRPLIILY